MGLENNSWSRLINPSVWWSPYQCPYRSHFMHACVFFAVRTWSRVMRARFLCGRNDAFKADDACSDACRRAVDVETTGRVVLDDGRVGRSHWRIIVAIVSYLTALSKSSIDECDESPEWLGGAADSIDIRFELPTLSLRSINRAAIDSDNAIEIPSALNLTRWVAERNSKLR